MKKYLLIIMLLICTYAYSQNRIDPTSLINDFTPMTVFNFNADSSHFVKGWNWSSESRKLDSALLMNFNHTGRLPDYDNNLSYLYSSGQNWILAIGEIAGGDRMSSITQAQALSYEPSLTVDPNYGVEIYDFDTKELIWKIPINGPSLTGIEFSPDDKYLVTSNDPGGNSLIVWSMETGKETHRYWPRSYDYVNISHDGKFVLSGIGRYIFLFYSRFGTSSVKENPNSQTVVYPNPTNNRVNIQFTLNKSENINIILYDITGRTINNIYSGYKEKGKQIIPYNCSQLPAGTYFIKITTPSFTKIFKFVKDS